MQIYQIGDELNITGYKSITLSGDENANIAAFAAANAISEAAAKDVLANISALKDFHANLSVADEEESYEDMDFDMSFLDETQAAQADNVSISNKETRAITTNSVEKTTQSANSSKTTASNSTTGTTQDKIDDINRQMEELKAKQNEAMKAEDDEAQYNLEQQENALQVQKKELLLQKAAEDAQAQGRTISTAETSLLSQKIDADFRIQRADEKRSYLEMRAEAIEEEIKNTQDAYAKYILEQQLNNITALDNIYEMEITNIKKQEKQLEDSLKILQNNYSSSNANPTNNAELAKILTDKADLQAQMIELASQKATAIQTEDDAKQMSIEQEEIALFEKLKKLEVEQAKIQAKIDGKTLTDTEISIIEESLEADFALGRVMEKRQYLSYKQIGIASQKSAAMQVGDHETQYQLGQQENNIEGVDKILEMEQTAIQAQQESINNAKELLATYDSAELADVLKQEMDLRSQLIEISQQKSAAVQVEDDSVLAKLEEQETKLLASLKELGLERAQIVATLNNETLSETDKKTISDNFDKNVEIAKLQEKIIHNEYKIVSLEAELITVTHANDKPSELAIKGKIATINAETVELQAKLNELTQGSITNNTTSPDVTGYTDIAWDYSKEFSINGITFTAYANSEEALELDITTDRGIVIINNANNIKIAVKSAEQEKNCVMLKGDNVEFTTDVPLYAVYNYADNSNITGSAEKDRIFNYAKNVTIDAGEGDDGITDRGENAKITTKKGDDWLYIESTAKNTEVSNFAKSDRMAYNKGTNTKTTYETSAQKDTPEYNYQIMSQYLHSAMNNTTPSFAETPSSELQASAQVLIDNLLTEDGEFNDNAKILIRYMQSQADKNDMPSQADLLLNAIIMMDLDNKDGLITKTELDNLINECKSALAPPKETGSNDVLEYAKSSTELKDLNLTDTEIQKIIGETGSAAAAMKLFKQIEVILKTNNSDYTKGSLKDVLINNFEDFNNEILADAQILVEAEELAQTQGIDKNAYIKSKLIPDATGMTTAEMKAATQPGGVMEKDGVLYVNDGKDMVALDISAETYLELFPPVSRYMVEQNSYNDCFFIATAMMDLMENGLGRANILKMFKESGDGDITVTFPGVTDYPITFEDGKLKTSDDSYTVGSSTITQDETENTAAALGLQMLEQAYALAKFAELSNETLTKEDIDELGETLYNAAKDGKISANDASNVDIDKALTYYTDGGYAQLVYDDLLPNNTNNGYTKIQNATQGKELLNKMAIAMADGKTSITTLITGATDISAIKDKYNFIVGHQYAVEDIDVANEIVYIKNPWDSYKVTAMPFDEFVKYFYGFASTTFA